MYKNASTALPVAWQGILAAVEADWNSPQYGDGLRSIQRPCPCMGMILGLSSANKALRTSSGWCPPQDATFGQMARVAIAYIERRPERMHEDFRSLAVEVMHEAWPCK